MFLRDCVWGLGPWPWAATPMRNGGVGLARANGGWRAIPASGISTGGDIYLRLFPVPRETRDTKTATDH
jgi:hypothetical protein